MLKAKCSKELSRSNNNKLRLRHEVVQFCQNRCIAGQKHGETDAVKSVYGKQWVLSR